MPLRRNPLVSFESRWRARSLTEPPSLVTAAAASISEVISRGLRLRLGGAVGLGVVSAGGGGNPVLEQTATSAATDCRVVLLGWGRRTRCAGALVAGTVVAPTTRLGWRWRNVVGRWHALCRHKHIHRSTEIKTSRVYDVKKSSSKAIQIFCSTRPLHNTDVKWRGSVSIVTCGSDRLTRCQWTFAISAN